jgi:hypothetical protein
MDEGVRLVLGILSMVTGAFKLISPMRGDVRIIGDLIPALAGLLVGAVLLLELHRGSELPNVAAAAAPSPSDQEVSSKDYPEGQSSQPMEGAAEAAPPALAGTATRARIKKRHRLEAFLLTYDAAIGYAAIFASAMHFLFPMELFL